MIWTSRSYEKQGYQCTMLKATLFHLRVWYTWEPCSTSGRWLCQGYSKHCKKPVGFNVLNNRSCQVGQMENVAASGFLSKTVPVSQQLIIDLGHSGFVHKKFIFSRGPPSDRYHHGFQWGLFRCSIGQSPGSRHMAQFMKEWIFQFARTVFMALHYFLGEGQSWWGGNFGGQHHGLLCKPSGRHQIPENEDSPTASHELGSTEHNVQGKVSRQFAFWVRRTRQQTIWAVYKWNPRNAWSTKAGFSLAVFTTLTKSRGNSTTSVYCRGWVIFSEWASSQMGVGGTSLPSSS